MDLSHFFDMAGTEAVRHARTLSQHCRTHCIHTETGRKLHAKKCAESCRLNLFDIRTEQEIATRCDGEVPQDATDFLLRRLQVNVTLEPPMKWHRDPRVLGIDLSGVYVEDQWITVRHEPPAHVTNHAVRKQSQIATAEKGHP